MKRIFLFVLLALMTLLIGQADADTMLSPGSSWEYTFTNPSGDSSWDTTTGGWSTGQAPFGNYIGPAYADTAGDFSYNTYWPATNAGRLVDVLWVRTLVNLSGYDLSFIYWYLGVDNGFELYVNGNLIAADNAELYTYRWEYGGQIPQSVLQSGNNIIAIELKDNGGLTAFDMQITDTWIPGNYENSDPTHSHPDNSIPEPSTILLLGFGLAGVGLFRRRFKN